MYYDQYFLVTDFLIKYGLGLSILIICILTILTLFILTFWFKCIIHAYKYNNTKDREFWLWILIISFFISPLGLLPPLIASIFYYITHRNEWDIKKNE